jgi:guanylate kinase
MPGQIYVVSGPSGVGKSSIIQAVRQRMDGLGYSVSHTSRKPRGREVDGVDYFFVDREAFRRMIDQGGFVEWARVYDDYYGTSFTSLQSQVRKGLDVIMDVDIRGAKNIKKDFEESVLIFILPPSLEALKNRLKHRGTEDEEVIGRRIEKASKEIGSCVWYDYLVFNDRLEEAVEETRSIIVAERCKRSRRMAKAEELFDIKAMSRGGHP